MGVRSALGKALIAVALTAVALLAAGTLATTAEGQAPCGTGHWVAAWTAAPSGLLGGGFSDQTLRIVLSPHVGADQLRVHISNRFGPKLIAINHATVALRQSGAALVPGTSRQVTFGGQAGVVVPAGGEAISDPASLTFAAFQDLAVSLYVMGPTGPATGHYIARERSYATAGSSGDHTADETAGVFGASTTAATYVDAVDAVAPAGVGAAVLFGDSITDGYENNGPGSGEEQGGIDLNHRYPDYLAQRLLAQPGGPRLSVVNAGISGNRLLADGQKSLAGPSGLSRLDPDVLGVAGATDAVVLEGINDIGLNATIGQLEAGLGQVVARLHAQGIHVLLGTITPAGTGLLNLGNLLPAIYIDSTANVTRVAVNGWIRSGASGADGIVDFDAALRGTLLPNELNSGFDSGDHVHPSYLGYKRMAEAVDLGGLRGTQCSPVAPRSATTLHVRARARSGRHLLVTGSLVPAGAGACTGAQVTVRALHGGRTVFKRQVRVTEACRFTATRSIPAPGRIEVRVSFAGSTSLLASKARPVYARLR